MDSPHEEEPKGPDFGETVNTSIRKAITSPEWTDYEIVLTFRGRQLIRGFEAKNITIRSRTKKGGPHVP